MNKEIRRNSDGEIEEYFRCECRSLDHFINVETYKDPFRENITDEVCLSMVISPKGFWSRIKKAFHLIFNNEITIEEILWTKDSSYSLENLNRMINTLEQARKELEDNNK